MTRLMRLLGATVLALWLAVPALAQEVAIEGNRATPGDHARVLSAPELRGLGLARVAVPNGQTEVAQALPHGSAAVEESHLVDHRRLTQIDLPPVFPVSSPTTCKLEPTGALGGTLHTTSTELPASATMKDSPPDSPRSLKMFPC